LASERPDSSSKKIATKINLKASPSTVKDGHTITLTATVSPSKATGTVSLYAGIAPGKPVEFLAERPLVKGVAKGSEKIPDGITGEFVIKAVYSGSKTYKSSTSSVEKVKVKE
jgi:hypothetical protein